MPRQRAAYGRRFEGERADTPAGAGEHSPASAAGPSVVLHHLCNELRVASSFYNACCHAGVSPRLPLALLPHPTLAPTCPHPMKRMRGVSMAECTALLRAALLRRSARCTLFALLDMHRASHSRGRAISSAVSSCITSAIPAARTTALLALREAGASTPVLGWSASDAHVLDAVCETGEQGGIPPHRLALLCDMVHTLSLPAYDVLLARVEGRGGLHREVQARFVQGVIQRRAVKDAITFLCRGESGHLCDDDTLTALVGAAVEAGRVEALKRLLKSHDSVHVRRVLIDACVAAGAWKAAARFVRTVPGMSMSDHPALKAQSQRATVGALLRMPARDLLVAAAGVDAAMHDHVHSYLRAREAEGASTAAAVHAAITAFDAAVAARAGGTYTESHLLALDTAAAALYTPREGDTPNPRQPVVTADGSHATRQRDMFVDAAGCVRLPPHVAVATVACIADLAAMVDAITTAEAADGPPPRTRLLGLDCEWVSTTVTDAARVSICTVAWRDHVWLLDMPALHASGEHAHMNAVLTSLFRGTPGATRVIVCVYGGTGDFSALRSQHPYVTAFGGDGTHVVHPNSVEALLTAAAVHEADGMTHMCDLMALARTRQLPTLPVPAVVVPTPSVDVATGTPAGDDADADDGAEELEEGEGEDAAPAPAAHAQSGGLAALTHACLGAKLCKYWQMSDWERRPLLPGQAEYAAMDAWVLPRILAVLMSLPPRSSAPAPLAWTAAARGRGSRTSK